MKAKVFIVVPVFNRLEYTKECLRAIEKQTYINIEVILIDDGSTDGSFEYVRRHFPAVHVIRGDGNLWWTKATHLGIEYALGSAKHHDYILLLNNDCFFDPGYLKQLLRSAKKYPKAVVGSFCVSTSRPVRVVEAGVRIDWPSGIVYSVAEAISTDPKYYRNMEVINQIDALPGKGTLVPVRLIKKMGSVNYKRMPHYIADYEFANRAKRHGYELLVDVKAVVKHHWEATGYRSTSDGPLSFLEAWNLLFGRKSMNNIIDWISFLLLTCPRQYLRVNLQQAFWRMINGFLRIFPLNFGYSIHRRLMKVIQFPAYLLKLGFYRTKLKIRQFPEYHLGRKGKSVMKVLLSPAHHLKLGFYRTKLKIRQFPEYHLGRKNKNVRHSG